MQKTLFSILSLCIDAVQSMIYPFVWHHILIPILPSHMTEFASCPSPFILGILSKNIKDWNSIQPDHVKFYIFLIFTNELQFFKLGNAGGSR